jgi:hypothetical protein
MSAGHVLRTVDAARELSVDPDKFLRLAKRAGVEGKRERHGHLFWSSANVAAVREYAEANGIELRQPG